MIKKFSISMFIIGICLFIFNNTILPNINFVNRVSTIAIKPTNSKLRLNNTSKVSGWSQESIVKDFGNQPANQWSAENYGSSAIITQDNSGTNPAYTNLIYSNSNAINYHAPFIRENSNAIVSLASGIVNNSNALIYGIKNNSNAIIYATESLFYEIKNNSNAIIKNSNDIENNSNALIFGLKDNSNTLLYLTKNNSNALLYGIKNNSNTLLYGINIINSLASNIENNSNAIIKNTNDIENNSNALISGLKDNSNTLLYLTKNNSNALLYGIKNNSNALLYGIKNNSNALLYGIKNNSNAILQFPNAIKDNSNAINYYAPIIRNNSYLLKNTSNSLVYIYDNITIIYDCDYYKGLARANSRGIVANSNAIIYYSSMINNNSNLIRTTSNALVYVLDNITIIPDINFIKTNMRVNSTGIAANSNAIILHDQYFSTIDHGPQNLGLDNLGDLEIHTIANPAGNIYRLNSNIYLSDDHKLVLPSGYFLLDGNGHTINFAEKNNNNLIIIPDNTTITTTNVTLYGFTPNCIKLNSGSNLIFDNNTCIELLENIDLNQTWSFAGNATLNGFGNQISLNSKQDNINILGTTGKLNIKDIIIDGLHESNLHATHNTGSLQLSNCELVLDRDFSFTIGTIKFDQDILITGTPAFIYESIFGSTINSNSTLKFDIGSTFSYAPAREKSINNPTNLIMQDSSSVLFLDGASLYSTNTGLELKNGTLKLDHKNFLFNRDGQKSAQSLCEAISFGDNSENLNIEILPGGNIELMSGILIIN